MTLGIRLPRLFFVRKLFFALYLIPHAVNAGAGLAVLNDLCLPGMGHLKPAGNLTKPPGTFLLPPDLLCGGRLNDPDLRLPAETAVEDEQKNYNGCYFENMIYKHETTPCSGII